MGKHVLKFAALLFCGALGLTAATAGDIVARDDFAQNEEENPAIVKGVLTLDGSSSAFKYHPVFEDEDLANFVLTFEGRLISFSDKNCFWGVEVIGDKGKFAVLIRPEAIHYLVKDGEGGFDKEASFKAPGPDTPFESLTLRRRGRRFQMIFGKTKLGFATMDIGTLEQIRLFSYNCKAEFKSYVLEKPESAAKETADAPEPVKAE